MHLQTTQIRRWFLKVAEAVAQFLADHVRHVFCISGGASLHLIHAVAARDDLQYICPVNEQCAGFEADAYARLKGMGCAIVTSGPGATNLVTPIAASWYDSVPVLYITGQQCRDRLVGNSGVRQVGFQETPIVDLVRPITKYSVTVMDKDCVLAELLTAVTNAKMGRPGPVLVDLPDDLQREQI